MCAAVSRGGGGERERDVVQPGLGRGPDDHHGRSWLRVGRHRANTSAVRSEPVPAFRARDRWIRREQRRWAGPLAVRPPSLLGLLSGPDGAPSDQWPDPRSAPRASPLAAHGSPHVEPRFVGAPRDLHGPSVQLHSPRQPLRRGRRLPGVDRPRASDSSGIGSGRFVCRCSRRAVRETRENLSIGRTGHFDREHGVCREAAAKLPR